MKRAAPGYRTEESEARDETKGLSGPKTSYHGNYETVYYETAQNTPCYRFWHGSPSRAMWQPQLERSPISCLAPSCRNTGAQRQYRAVGMDDTVSMVAVYVPQRRA
jgi:hypothetical protein